MQLLDNKVFYKTCLNHMPDRSKDYLYALYKIMSQDVWDVLEVKHGESCNPNKQKDVIS